MRTSRSGVVSVREIARRLGRSPVDDLPGAAPQRVNAPGPLVSGLIRSLSDLAGVTSHSAAATSDGHPGPAPNTTAGWKDSRRARGLLRQYFPKGTDLARRSAEEIEDVAAALNSRPRKTLDWKPLPKQWTSPYC
jgi:hypothetical protein